MKTSKLDGFGRLGVAVHDIDLRSAGDVEIEKLGYLVLDQLVVVVPKAQAVPSLERLHQICTSWALEIPGGGYDASPMPGAEAGEYQRTGRKPDKMSDEDFEILKEGLRFGKGCSTLNGMCRVTGIKDEHGNSTGMFSDGELEWHSNQQGTHYIGASVTLIGWEGSEGTTTEFLNTVDAYEELDEERRRLCDELIAVHRWKKGVMAPGISAIQDKMLSLNMCPVDDTETPLVTWSPAGRKGLHFAFTTIHHFKGMSVEESQKLIAELQKHVIRDRYVYAHHWQDGDILFFDNTVTLHRRPTKDCSKRLMYRVAANYDRLLASKGVAPWKILNPPLKKPLPLS